eukprot:CAMPEP_0184546404 /NCGR_PEP_ID=MMETSP0199_2-20130426/4938_1 /TAXON_ID=1112570 /ORGANISM="Thraustochytrium sp., Strain LLF1b" /LENGTH=140 /DNA_ID=CAMNT_0026940807 /DNA_START=631 /DNA_END=1053 /DNA_ORIENTATION=+
MSRGCRRRAHRRRSPMLPFTNSGFSATATLRHTPLPPSAALRHPPSSFAVVVRRRRRPPRRRRGTSRQVVGGVPGSASLSVLVPPGTARILGRVCAREDAARGESSAAVGAAREDIRAGAAVCTRNAAAQQHFPRQAAQG